MFKLFNSKIYELENTCENLGMYSQLHKIIGKNKLIAKVSKFDDIEELKNDLEIGNLLRRNGISTPKYIGIAKGKLNGEIVDILVMEFVEDSKMLYRYSQNLSPEFMNKLFRKEIDKL
ncbi:MAG: hypothetical protein HRU03_03125 [Nanoarchaeales archaeon]|nr:hypothetical protein [Nanoarchaeales archaeon]